MSKILAIFGATGQQGGSVLFYVLSDPELSKKYIVRAVTRDPSSSSAESLKKLDVEVVKGDSTDKTSLSTALKGVHTVFAMTNPDVGPNAKSGEIVQGKNIAEVAVEEKVNYIIFSTLPSVTQLSGGRYTNAHGFDAKAEVEQYIRTLPIKSAFFAPGSFMQNFQTSMPPQPNGFGGYVIALTVSPQTKLPLIDAAGDTGKYVGAILAEPEKYETKIFCAASALYSLEEVAQIMSKSTGKDIAYKQIPEENFRAHLPPYLPADVIVEVMLYQQDFGYYGPQSKELVVWAAENARGKVHTFEEYLKQSPLSLK